MLRRQFLLGPVDKNALDATGLRWETINDQGERLVVIHQRPLPPGFDIAHTDTALALPPSYPDGQIDSVYLRPCPVPLKGRALSHVTHCSVDRANWHCFCRHRSRLNCWRPGLDDIAAHLALVDHWLLQALRSSL